MWSMDFNSLCDLVNRSLPGRTKWMQCIPVWDEDSWTEEGVGLAITAEYGPGSYWYNVVFFSVVPAPGATADDGGFLPGRGDGAADWTVETGYAEDFDTIEEAVEGAKALSRNLPTAGIFPTRERFEAALDRLDETDEREATTAPGA